MPSYSIHPSSQLVELFKDKPFQGANPEEAKIIILGNDANYSPEISDHPFFNFILEYHSDGVKFWKTYGVHHPFLLSDYPFNKNSGGVPYHRKFSKLGFTSENAEDISFVELLDIPTVGNTGQDKNLFFELMRPAHLQWLEDLIYSDQNKFVVVNQTLARNIMCINRKTGLLSKLNTDIYNKPSASLVVSNNNLTLYNGYSFSASHCSNAYLNELSDRLHGFTGIKDE